MRILIVEDNRKTAVVLREALEDMVTTENNVNYTAYVENILSSHFEQATATHLHKGGSTSQLPR